MIQKLFHTGSSTRRNPVAIPACVKKQIRFDLSPACTERLRLRSALKTQALGLWSIPSTGKCCLLVSPPAGSNT